jgi:DsbC/DsbD-like thiol-disulfide interchange protein
VSGADLHGGMARHVGEFGRGAQEAAAFPLRMPRRARQVAEDALDLRRQAVVGLCKPLPEQREIGLVAASEIRRHQIILAAEVVVQRALAPAPQPASTLTPRMPSL